jgi:transposase
VSDVVDTLDLSAIEGTYDEEHGYPPYHPRMMVKALLYGYCTGTYSSRKIARQLLDHVPMRFLAPATRPTSGRSGTSASATARTSPRCSSRC